jgi:hypothetical protein
MYWIGMSNTIPHNENSVSNVESYSGIHKNGNKSKD